MPVLSGADFVPKRPFKNGHLNTLAPHLFGSAKKPNYHRQRIETPDGDFLDIDWLKKESSTSIYVLCHGLEGSSHSNYVTQFANYIHTRNCDVLAMNYRGCSGHTNRLLISYNSGTTQDLDLVIDQIDKSYENIYLVGFSLGGNLILKYIGENKFVTDTRIRSAVAISTPVHLSDSSASLLNFENKIYQLKFLVSLFRKVYQKNQKFPDKISLKPWWKIRNLYDFDQYYTAPIYGYKDAEEYYSVNQSIQWLDQIKIPAYIINAKDDPFLGDLCYPFDVAEQSEIVSLCAPEYGGHVGFTRNGFDRSWLLDKTWSLLHPRV